MTVLLVHKMSDAEELLALFAAVASSAGCVDFLTLAIAREPEAVRTLVTLAASPAGIFGGDDGEVLHNRFITSAGEWLSLLPAQRGRFVSVAFVPSSKSASGIHDLPAMLPPLSSKAPTTGIGALMMRRFQMLQDQEDQDEESIRLTHVSDEGGDEKVHRNSDAKSVTSLLDMRANSNNFQSNLSHLSAFTELSADTTIGSVLTCDVCMQTAMVEQSTQSTQTQEVGSIFDSESSTDGSPHRRAWKPPALPETCRSPQAAANASGGAPHRRCVSSSAAGSGTSATKRATTNFVETPGDCRLKSLLMTMKHWVLLAPAFEGACCERHKVVELAQEALASLEHDQCDVSWCHFGGVQCPTCHCANPFDADERCVVCGHFLQMPLEWTRTH